MHKSGGATTGDRGQLSLSAIEAVVGTLLVLAVVAGFGLGDVTAHAREAQLDTYAADAARVLEGDPPARDGATRLSAVSRSAAGFANERDALDRRVRELLPETVLFQVRTPQGTVGYPRPEGVPIGRAVVPTTYGDVTIRVWYV